MSLMDSEALMKDLFSTHDDPSLLRGHIGGGNGQLLYTHCNKQIIRGKTGFVRTMLCTTSMVQDYNLHPLLEGCDG